MQPRILTLWHATAAKRQRNARLVQLKMFSLSRFSNACRSRKSIDDSFHEIGLAKAKRWLQRSHQEYPSIICKCLSFGDMHGNRLKARYRRTTVSRWRAGEVPLMNPSRSLSLDGANRSNCPSSDLGEAVASIGHRFRLKRGQMGLRLYRSDRRTRACFYSSSRAASAGHTPGPSAGDYAR